MPAISVLMPVWNGLPYLREAVESVLSQGYTDWELIISDNGSTDGSREYLESLSDPRIRVCLQEANLGIFGNLNFLFGKATAPFSYILCADDYFLPGALDRVLRTWQSQETDVAYIRFNFGENLQKCYLCKYSHRVVRGVIPSTMSNGIFFLFGNISGNLSNVSARTEYVHTVNGFREDLPYAGDFEMWARLGRQWPFLVTDIETVTVRRHEGVASNYLNKRGELVAQQRRIVEDLYERLKASCPNWLLRLHGTLNYDSLQRDCGIRLLVRARDWGYLARVEESAKDSPILFHRINCWIIYFISLGGRWGRDLTASLIIKRLFRLTADASQKHDIVNRGDEK